jgi:hypothetical protein
MRWWFAVRVWVRWYCRMCIALHVFGVLRILTASLFVATLAGIPVTAVSSVVMVVLWAVAIRHRHKAVVRAHANGHPGKR